MESLGKTTPTLLMVVWPIVLVTILAPMLLAAEMTANCWAHNKTREACDPDGQIPEMVTSATGTVFAWLANPPK